jgi:DNA-binding NarL/FixJ family response regulator
MKPINKVIDTKAILKRPFEGYGLSSSEKEIMMLALRGQTNESIATDTNRPIGTVNAYSNRALRKLPRNDGSGKYGITKSELGWFVIKKVWEVING